MQIQEIFKLIIHYQMEQRNLLKELSSIAFCNAVMALHEKRPNRSYCLVPSSHLCRRDRKAISLEAMQG